MDLHAAETDAIRQVRVTWDKVAEEEPDDEAALSIEDEVLSIEDEVLSIVNEGSIVPLVYDSSIMSDIQVSEWCLEEQLQVVEGRLMASLFDAITFGTHTIQNLPPKPLTLTLTICTPHSNLDYL